MRLSACISRRRGPGEVDGLTAPRDSLFLAKRCARLLDEKKLEEIVIFDVAHAIQITDYFVLASGLNSRHLRSASDHLVREFREQGILREGLEGHRDGKWILIDFDDVVVHLFLAEQRRHYDLELLWGDCPRIDDWAEENPSAASSG